MQTVREIIEAHETKADIFEICNVKSTGIFYYEEDRIIKDFGSRLVEETFLIKGIGGHDAILRFYLKKKEE